MSYLNIFNLQFNKYRLTTSFEENIVYGVFCKDSNVRKEFLKLIAGINNNSNSIFYLDENNKEINIFDSKDYFNKRLYIDFSHKYLKTLNVNTISETLKTRFNQEFNVKEYKNAVTNTNLRSEVLLTNEYQFTDLGVTLSSFCMFKGLSYQYNFIDNPVININNSDLIKKIYSNISKRELNPVIGFDNLNDCKDYCDRIIVLDEYQDVVVIDLENDTFMISNDNVILRKKIFKCNDMIISVNTYTKEELKYLSKNKVKYKIITFNDVVKMIGGNDEK